MTFCRVITSREEFFNINEQWNELLERSVTGSFSSRWEWLNTWLDNYGDIVDSLLVILVCDDNSGLIGAAPFFFSEFDTKLGRFPQIRFIGTGEPEEIEVASEYLDILAVSGSESTVCELIVETLLSHAVTWERLTAENILQDSIFVKLLMPIMQRHGCNNQSTETGQRFSVTLPISWDDYLCSIRPSVKNRILSSRRKIAKRGKLTEKSSQHEQQRDKTIQILGRLHTRQWERKSLPGAFASSEFNAFHDKIIGCFADQGLLRLRTCAIDNEVISVLYNVRFKQREHYYQSGFDMDTYSKYRPGMIAHSYAIQDCIATGIKEYDFMKGIAPSYKQDYGAHATPMYTSLVFNRSRRGRHLYIQTEIKNLLTLSKDRLKQIYR